MSQKNFFNFVILLSFFSLSFANNGGDCMRYHSTNSSSSISFSCAQCKRGFVLTSDGSSCIKAELKLVNCIQLSALGECMLCECGFSLQVEKSICVPTPLDIIGCDTFQSVSTCIRPKQDFTLFQESAERSFVEFSRGSHCEIWNVSQEKCVRCHSGFKFNSDNKCIKAPHKLINEYLSYYSEDGDIQSRSILLEPTPYGVYFQIPFCQKQYAELGNEKLFCELCEQGKILSVDKTKCLKPPFQGCGKVSDYNPNICEECLENDYFYLDTSNPQYPVCLPRLKVDPTERCLQRFNHYSSCNICAKGLIKTSQGCNIDENIVDEVDEEKEEQQSLGISRQQKIITTTYCEYFTNGTTCISCKKGMILDSQGNCQQQTDINCLIPSQFGDCLKCQSLMYYNKEAQKCIPITQVSFCRTSSGFSDRCETCMSSFYIQQDQTCTIMSIDSCLYSLGKDQKCEKCDNLHFLKPDGNCEIITDYELCYASDGINNKCLICLRGISKDEDNNKCLPEVAFENGECLRRDYYRISETSQICAKYSFGNYQFCYQYHPTQNECLECQAGFFLRKGNCEAITACMLSDGIHDWCYQGWVSNSYIDEKGNNQFSQSPDCKTNQIIGVCRNCELEDGSDGLSSNTQCYQINQVDPEIARNCFQLKETNDQLYCEICQNLYYPDQNGICKPLSHPNCAVSDTKSDSCKLCMKGYILKEIQSITTDSNISASICELRDNFIIPFCLVMKDNNCLKCQSLYYPYQYFCQLISDPDCIESDGILDRCSVCSNGIIFAQNNFPSHCSTLEYCLIPDNQYPQCLLCKEGYSKRGSKENTCQPQKVQHCEIEEIIIQECIKCKPGYFKRQQQLKETQIFGCIEITIPYCLDMTPDGRDCKQCAEGYALLQNSHCYKIENCQTLQAIDKSVCLKCYDQYYLNEGVCISIENCQEQYQRTCMRCSQGYYVMKNGQNQQLKINKLHEKQQKSIITPDKCERILHCEESNGIDDACLRCENGFKLKGFFCIQSVLDQQNCLVFNENNQCLKCKKMFYLNQENCIKVSIANCTKMNGIFNQCTKCSLNGFVLDDSGKCQFQMKCVISNGLDSCVLCEQHYIVSTLGTCEEITTAIEHCEIYSTQKVPIFPEYLNEEDSKELIRNGIVFQPHQPHDNIENLLQTLHLYGKEENNLEIIAGQRCIQCASSYMKNGFGECLQTNIPSSQPAPQLDSNYCLIFDRDLGFCIVCKYHLFPKVELNITKTSCVVSKQRMRFMNPGCAILSFQNTCWQCFEGFYLDEERNCKPRRIIQKCLILDPKKDECLQCRNGYKFMEIQDGWQDMKICMRLEPDEEVRNCREYYPNSNKCKTCRKRLKQDIAEFRLNVEANICEDVLHLMCREVDPVRNSCVQQYIAYCEEYTSSPSNQNEMVFSQCLRCQNGYYLKDQTECIKHNLILNCLHYSQQKPNTCEICENLYFLKSNSNCNHISDNNCQLGRIDEDYCQKCARNLTIDYKTGTCFDSSISNCLIANISQEIEVCLECRKSFKIIENGRKCVFDLFDENCKIFNKEKTACQVCNEGYLLNYQQICIPIKYSLCDIPNCLEYSLSSKAEDIKCKKCQQNYYLHTNFKCQPFDPDSNIHQQGYKNLTNNQSSSNNSNSSPEQEIQHSDPESQALLISMRIFICLILFAFLLIVVFLLRRRWFMQRQQSIFSCKQNVEEEDESQERRAINNSLDFI